MAWVKRNKDFLMAGVFLVVCLFFLSGCTPARAVGDFVFGVEETPVLDEAGNPVIDPETGKPKTTPAPTDGPAPIVPLAGLFGFGALAEAIAGAYRLARARGVDKSFEGVVVGIEEMIRSGKIKKKDVYPMLIECQKLYGNRDIAAKLIAEIKAAYRAKNPPPVTPAS